MVASDDIKAGVAGAALAGRELAHALVVHELIRRISRNAATAPAIDLNILRVGLGVASEIGFEERLLVDDVGRGVDHVAPVVRIDAVGRPREEEVRHKLVVSQRDRARAVVEFDIRQKGQPVP